jgi:hypothetical protein
MSRAKDSYEVHALFDVPGTGFRDREDSAMYNQYHKNGWQATWTHDGRNSNLPRAPFPFTLLAFIRLLLDARSLDARSRVHATRGGGTTVSVRDSE